MRISAFIAILILMTTTACSVNDREPGDGKVTVYSTRSETLMRPLVQEFEKQTGINVTMHYGDSHHPPTLDGVDVFLAYDSEAVRNVETELAELPEPIWRKVPAQYRDPAGRWAGVSQRTDGTFAAVGILRHAHNDKDARHFAGNLFSKEGQATFDENGERPLVADAREVVEADKRDLDE